MFFSYSLFILILKFIVVNLKMILFAHLQTLNKWYHAVGITQCISEGSKANFLKSQVCGLTVNFRFAEQSWKGVHASA